MPKTLIPSECFQSNAAWARANLGMATEEFYSLTPSEFQSIYQQWKLAQRRQDSWWAKLCYVVAASAGAKLDNDTPIPFDFFAPWYRPSRSGKHSIVNSFLSIVGSERVVDNRKPKKKKK